MITLKVFGEILLISLLSALIVWIVQKATEGKWSLTLRIEGKEENNMQKIICDRCGNSAQFKVIFGHESLTTVVYDLCDACAQKVALVISGADIQYQKPIEQK